jgi:predicted enzyme related to lactoylglutathione lyase
MNAVTHFEIPAEDLKRARDFYSKVFGWVETMDMGDALMVNTSETDDTGFPMKRGRINGDFYKKDEKLKHPMVVMDVENIDEKAKEIEAAGGTIITEKIEVADMGWCMYFKDTEGNVLGIWQTKNMDI